MTTQQQQQPALAQLPQQPAAAPTLTMTQIPCCLCGTLIIPNAANQCSTCLAQQFNLSDVVQRGPGGSSQIIVYQCRNCRRYGRTEKHYEAATPESPELLSICLKHIPALANTADPRLHLIDAAWIWTEPHSMRFKLRLTVRTLLQDVTVQQRVKVELHCQFKMCPDCNREFTNRTWQAVVQVRQQRVVEDGATKKGLASLEMAIASSAVIRKHVLKIDTTKNGFDFYFLSQVHAQTFCAFLQRVAPMRIKTSTKLVSTDVKSNTTNSKITTMAQMVPLCRYDLLLIHKKSIKNKMAGRLVLVTAVSSVIHGVDVSPKRDLQNTEEMIMELSPEPYYREQKYYKVLQAAHRLTRFVVLDVELCQEKSHYEPSKDKSNSKTGGRDNSKYELADVQVARESDFGVNDEMFTTVTHLGHLLQAGDVVLGYDLVSNTLDYNLGDGAWEMEDSLLNQYVVPDVILVKKVQGGSEATSNTTAKSSRAATSSPTTTLTKKQERRKRYKEGKRHVDLEQSAMRMGFVLDEDTTKTMNIVQNSKKKQKQPQQPSSPEDDVEEDDGDMLDDDFEIAAEELSALERDFNALTTNTTAATENAEASEDSPLPPAAIDDDENANKVEETGNNEE